MSGKSPLELLTGTGAIITDSHIVYTSGRHGSSYVNKDAVYPHTKIISSLCKKMADEFKGQKIDAVCGPTVGGVILAQWVAHFLSEMDGKNILAVYSEVDENGNRILKRGYDKLVKGKRVLVVEDILTTGGSVAKVVSVLAAAGATVVGCSALVNRGGVSEKEVGNVPILKSLIKIDMTSWEEKECPLCKSGKPINTDVGKGREYLTKKQS